MGRRAEEALLSRKGAQLGTDLLEQAARVAAPELLEAGPSRLVICEQLARELSAAHLVEQLAHRLLHSRVDDARAAGQVAVLGDVGDRVAHVLEPALVDEVDDQLQLVQALVVRDLGLVTRLDERLETGLDQRGDAAAEAGLLAEEVALGLLCERRLQQSDAPASDRSAVRERELERLAARVLVDGDEAGGAGTGLVQLAHAMTRRLRRDHDDVVLRSRDDAAEVDVQPVREQERCVGLQIRLDLVAVHPRLHMVRHEDGDDPGFRSRSPRPSRRAERRSLRCGWLPTMAPFGASAARAGGAGWSSWRTRG